MMMRALMHTALALTAIMAATSCRDELASTASRAADPDKVPTMSSTNVQTVISDSGRTRYRITTKQWLMFEESKKPHWIFPQGVIAEELDAGFKTVTSVRCDSAYFDEKARLWSLNGNVRITNAAKDLILTDQMYWNQGEHRLYSDAFIHIEKLDRVIEGYGYESNEKLTTYKVHKVKAIFPIDQAKMPGGM